MGHPEMSEIEADDVITPTPSVTVPTTESPTLKQELVEPLPPDPAPSHVCTSSHDQTSPASPYLNAICYPCWQRKPLELFEPGKN